LPLWWCRLLPPVGAATCTTSNCVDALHVASTRMAAARSAWKVSLCCCCARVLSAAQETIHCSPRLL
jgi:hypothetical protein